MYLERKGKENNSSNLRTGSTVKQLFSILTEKGGEEEVNQGKDQPYNREDIWLDCHLQCF